MKTVVVTTVALALVGCAATPPPDPSLASYVGRNISALTSPLGPAAKRFPSGSDTIYAWTKVETVDGIVNGDEFQASQNDQGSSRFNSNQCKVSATVDGSSVIKSLHADGNCTRTIDLLRK